jgi:tubulin monoglycylase TTLL3/8
MLKCFKEG